MVSYHMVYAIWSISYIPYYMVHIISSISYDQYRKVNYITGYGPYDNIISLL